jgi:hypothetical protein
MRRNSVGNMIWGVISVTILVLIIISILKWLKLMIGTPTDWIIGIAGFWWLLVVVTIPWNLYFKTKEILSDAIRLDDDIRDPNIEVSKNHKGSSERDINYAKKLGKYALLFAISLHLISSGVFYLLAFYKITPIGYIASIIALLLTLLRPLIRGYEYLNNQLLNMQNRINYPKDNVYTLKSKVDNQERIIKDLEYKLNLNDKNSWAFRMEAQDQDNNTRIQELLLKLDEYNQKNILEHNRISKESKDAMSQLTIDGEFLNHIREIIRFFKKA